VCRPTRSESVRAAMLLRVCMEYCNVVKLFFCTQQFVSTQIMVQAEPKLLRTLRRTDACSSIHSDKVISSLRYNITSFLCYASVMLLDWPSQVLTYCIVYPWAHTPLVSNVSSLGEFPGYWDWLRFPGLPPESVSIAFPFCVPYLGVFHSLFTCHWISFVFLLYDRHICTHTALTYTVYII